MMLRNGVRKNGKEVAWEKRLKKGPTNSDTPFHNFVILIRLNNLDLCKLFFTEWQTDLDHWFVKKKVYTSPAPLAVRAFKLPGECRYLWVVRVSGTKWCATNISEQPTKHLFKYRASSKMFKPLLDWKIFWNLELGINLVFTIIYVCSPSTSLKVSNKKTI